MGASHHGQVGRRVSHNQAWVVGLATHGVVTCPVGIAYDNSEFRHYRVGHRIDQFGSVLDNPPMLGLATDHKACNVLKENQRDTFLVTVGYKAGCLICTIGVDHPAYLHLPFAGLDHLALVGYNPYCPAIYTRIACENCLPIAFLVFLPLGVIYQAEDQLLHIIGLGTANG